MYMNVMLWSNYQGRARAFEIKKIISFKYHRFGVKKVVDQKGGFDFYELAYNIKYKT